MKLTTFEQYRIENADLFKATLENSKVEKEIKDEILAFINSFPTMDFNWDMDESFDEGLQRWGDDFETVCHELAEETKTEMEIRYENMQRM